jgi:2-polyprenyl-3-methyl-5-hydroxy-6-metoxy-1,4-benzoquinol methylase
MAANAPTTSRYAGEGFVLAKPVADLAVRVCPACESGEGRQLGIKNDLPIVSCNRCATLYTTYEPWYSSEEFYSGYYPQISSEPEFVKLRLAETIATFDSYRHNNRLLDLGCGTGALLEIAEKHGWQAQGLDVSRTVIEHGRKLGLNVLCAEIGHARFASESFDVVTASELLEHVPHPKSLISEVARVLRPGGLFWTTTPHARGVSARLLGMKWTVLSPPEHMQLFSITGIKKLLRAAGFKAISVRTEGTNPHELMNEIRPATTSKERGEQNFNRVESTYRLNEMLMKGKFRRLFKSTANEILNSSRLGDSIKIRAVR